MKYFAHISYDGTRFSGWQRQISSVVTIQQVIEEALSKVLKSNCIISGCGRTDSGVHAQNYYFNFDIYKVLDFDLVFRMNKVLPNSICFVRIIKVHESANARFDAKWRTYNYFFHQTSSPFLNSFSTCIDHEVNLESFYQATLLIAQTSDFRFFCKSPDKHRTTICNIDKIELYQFLKRDMFRLEVRANRFLRGMIRIIMDRLFAVAKGEMSLIEFKNILEGKRDELIKPAFPQGLHLSDISYEYIEPHHSPTSHPYFGQLDDWKIINGF